MTLFCRLSLLTLVAGMLLGEITIASVGLVALCTGAVIIDIRSDRRANASSEPEFLA
ncbi:MULTISPECIES: hypothetical protein [Pseudomonas]|uniref:Uncharacterized protein n=1 Tax=Pseudomonas hunanensis TaxID=1247546 RepID=A0ACC6JYV6_9PSED|nr:MULTISPECIES: hypothetical protein [Pseudomonas]MBP2262193.1 hypothetical protein [Pseudomonas sp. BP8]MDR6711403.1 hypothetical protein [Pseudomonas hunanensis]HDS1733119.1 hypothetical protein [Pseudomonas putida]